MRKLTLMMSVIALFTTGTFAQVYQKPVQDTERGRIVKTTSSKMVGARTFTSTQYCLSGKTASGSLVRQGIIAADPRVLPLGTKVMIQGLGVFLVTDTGGKIKGNIVDIWNPSCNAARQYGRRSIQLAIIK